MIIVDEMSKRKNLVMINRLLAMKRMKIGAEQVPAHSSLPVKKQHMVSR